MPGLTIAILMEFLSYKSESAEETKLKVIPIKHK